MNFKTHLNTYLKLLPAVIVALSPLALASSSDLPEDWLSNKAPFSVGRPCCGLPLIKVATLFGTSALLGGEQTGFHRFYKMKVNKNLQDEGVGIVYSLKGGFIDLGHLRDHADWTAHILYRMRTSTDAKIKVSSEQAERTLEFHDLARIKNLSNEDQHKIAIRIAYEGGIWHEIVTGLGIDPAGTYVMKQRMSAFSPEDLYSNLLGASLGAKAFDHKLPYNRAMSALLDDALFDLDVVAKDETAYHFEQARGVFWNQSFLPKTQQVPLRQTHPYKDWVFPARLDVARANCESVAVPYRQEVPHHLSDGSKVTDWFTLHVRPNHRVYRRLGITPSGHLGFSQKDFPMMIEKVRERFSRELGADFEMCR